MGGEKLPYLSMYMTYCMVCKDTLFKGMMKFKTL